MYSLYDIINGLTTDSPTMVDKPTLLSRFANLLGWTPSYHLFPGKEVDFANIHLVVEHGLENTAILTFLKTPYSLLTNENRNFLLNISYNNLVDWHIHVEKDKITYVYNRLNSSKNVIDEFYFKRDDYDQLRSEAFDKIIGRKPNPNIPALDDALINTVSYWKRSISSELEKEDINEPLSSLFNSIMFVRAVEDNLRRYNKEDSVSRILSWAWNELKTNTDVGISEIIELALNTLGSYDFPDYLVDFDQLRKLKSLSKQSISYLIGDFYENKHASLYHYDFSIISMHALSRIYERYVSLLKVEADYQLFLFPSFKNLAKEEINKAFGSIYTPQYIARFFAQYLKQHLTPTEFKRIKIAEPAVGSGIFLRSLLEIKCDPRQEGITDEEIVNAFGDLLGVDVDPNATKATELSLALLQLVLVNTFPMTLNIQTRESIEYFSENPELNGTFDVVLSNPPFIPISSQSDAMKERISKLMDDLGVGRTDTYIAFLKISIDLLKPGGYGLFVLPHSFLASSSGVKLRQFISETCSIKCLVDLSAIEVFENTGIYVILLIIQKDSKQHFLSQYTTVVKCRDFVGKALVSAINEREEETDFYSVYNVDREHFHSKQWFILPSSEIKIQQKLKKFPELKEFVEITQGFVTGNDEVFLFAKAEIPSGEEAIFVPYLRDKEISSFNFDKETSIYLFYPFLGNKKIEESEMSELFPQTWGYLNKHKEKLSSNKSLRGGTWWKPLWPRSPEKMMRSKIVTPHLTITPKFAIDLEGKFAVSHSPFLIPKSKNVSGEDLLLYLVGILNSAPCYWYISNHSHKYNHGYNRLEVSTLKSTPIPDPSLVPSSLMNKLLNLVKERSQTSTFQGRELERKINSIVAELYGLNQEDQSVLGIQ
ncbi:Eco57I restriction-modification methylase domain-containing protein [Dyadobacter arcticus]|uniref:site-specific DNA-methyltransferase (adenine-specific) n=1 Tax=Dyadobacter arcticus TaxID=1078754 RepID=A0ABX0UQ78_9BACT|nr:N-6 DNA methylase [Dyadobacter arcticus]NIJ53830.1 methylase of polypeptide subunit release factors [Dyadobacter arcticus]